ILASHSCFIFSNSSIGKDGSRKISRTSFRTSGKCSRSVSIDAVAEEAPPPTPARAFKRSSSSLICCRVLRWVPLSSIVAVKSAMSALPFRLSSVPKCRVIVAFTASPRFSFGNSAYFNPFFECSPRGALFDVLRRSFEILALRDGWLAFVIFQQRGKVRRCRNGRTIGVVLGNEESDRAIRSL